MKPWERALKYAKASKLTLYVASRGIDNAPGHVVSNEFDHFSMQIPKGGGQALLGFGSTQNWDICARRKNEYLFLVDQSSDILIAHHCFYRPLFLACDTAEEFLSALSGDKTRIEACNELNPTEREFTLEVLKAVPGPEKPYPFQSAHFDHEIAKAFELLYDPKLLSKQTKLPQFLLRASRFSFLASKENYVWVRDLYRNNRVRFALSSIDDSQLYKALQKELLAVNSALTDIHVTNIPSFLTGLKRWNEVAVVSLWKGFLDQSRKQKILVFETRGLSVPFEYLTHSLTD